MSVDTWTEAAGNNEWDDAENWSADKVPGSGDEALIATGDTELTTATTVDSIDIDGFGGLIVQAPGLVDVVKTDVSITRTNASALPSLVISSAEGADPTNLYVHGNLLNSASLAVDNNINEGGSRLEVAGTLTNSGTFQIGSTNGVSSDTRVKVGDLQNTGSISIRGGFDTADEARLIVNSDAPSVWQNASYLLSGHAVLEYAGGSVTNIGSKATLSLAGAYAQITDVGGTRDSALAELATNGGTISLAGGARLSVDPASFRNSGSLNIQYSTLSTGGNFTNMSTGRVDLDDQFGGFGNNAVGHLEIEGSLSNYGTITLSQFASASALSVGKSFDNFGTFTVGNPFAHSFVRVGSFDNTGALNLEADTSMVVRDGDAPDSVISGSSLLLGRNTFLQFAAGEITSISANASLELDGPHTRIADASSANTNSALSELSSNAGLLYLGDGVRMTNAAVDFTNSGTFSMDDGQTFKTDTGVGFTNLGTVNVESDNYFSTHDSILSIGGTLTNSGTLNVGSSDPGSTATVKAENFVNTGTIDITSFSTQFQASVLALHNVAPSELTSGVSLILDGNTLLEYEKGGIVTIDSGAEISLAGSGLTGSSPSGASTFIADKADPTHDSALFGLDSNAGTFSVADGVVYTSYATSFTNSGTIDLTSHYTIENTSLTLSGTLTNSGTVNFSSEPDLDPTALSMNIGSLDNSGTIDMSILSGSGTESLTAAGSITNTGTIEASDAAASVANAISITASGNFTQQSGETSLDVSTSLLSAVEINVTGGRLASAGELVGNVTVTGGVLATGSVADSSGVQIAGNLSLSTGGTLQIDIVAAGSGAATDFQVEGNVQLNGGALQIDISDPQNLAIGEQFAVVSSSANGLSGEFSELDYGSAVGTATSVNIGNGLAIDATYSADNIELTVVSSDSPARAANALETLSTVATGDGFQFSQSTMSALGHINSVVAVSGANLGDAVFEAHGLGSHEALLFTETSGAHYLMIDTSGDVGFLAGQHFVVALTSPEASAFSHLG
jgi:hypothetical protein